MDLNISGSGQISAGEYDNIRISGSGHAQGPVRCNNFHVSGSADGGELVCANELQVSGSSVFSGTVTVGSLVVSGSISCGEIAARDRITISGVGRSSHSMKCRELNVSGVITVTEDIEAETAVIRGKACCEGLLNAESLEVEFCKGMDVGSIGGSKIDIYKKYSKRRMGIFAFLGRKAKHGRVWVKNAIEGDDIRLEGVIAPRVSGRVVIIGEDCEIELVQYSESIEVSPKAKVSRTERV